MSASYSLRFLPFARPAALAALLLATSQCGMRETISEKPAGATSEAARRPGSPRAERKEDRSAERVEFGLNVVDQARLGGIDIMPVRQATDLKATDQTRLQDALKTGAVPLRLSLRVYGRNPTNELLKLSMLAYEVRIDDQPVASGNTGANTMMEPKSIVTLPITVSANVHPVLARTTPGAFAAGLTDLTGASPRLTVRVLPTFINQAGRMFQPQEFVAVPVITPESRRN